MKAITNVRMGLFALLLMLVGCAQKPEPTASIYPLDGVEPAVYYTAPTPLNEGYKGELAIIMIQGWHGGVHIIPGYFALQDAIKDSYVILPMFPRNEMMQTYNIEPDGRAIWNDSWPLDLTIPGVPDDDWRGGGDANGTELSSFDIIDLLLAKFSDKKAFPNLKRVALVGFSAGGQFVGRYVAVGKGEVAPHLELVYAAMAPSTFLIPDPNDTWHYGLKNRPRYSRELSEEQIMENLRSRRCLHACGDADTLEKALDKTASAMKQGENRYVRFLNFQALVNSDPRWKSVTTFHTFKDIGHKSTAAYADPVFIKYVTE